MVERAVILERASASLWEFEKLRNPKFFRDDRPHLKVMADALQGVFERKMLRPDGKPYRKICIDLPPRHGKSYTLANFCAWALGRDNASRIGDISYNDDLSTRFSRQVRTTIEETKADPNLIIYNDVFPGTRMRYGDAAVGSWALDGQYISFLSTSFGGTLTGVGLSIGIIDDPIKSHKEASNDKVLADQYDWYRDTFLSRLEEGSMTVIVMTRWANGDLAGCVQRDDPGEWLVLAMPAYNKETDSMLCPDILSRETYEFRKARTSPAIFDANYQQVPVDSKDRMYTGLRTYRYDELPKGPDGAIAWDIVAAYADTADEGTDYLCLIIAGIIAGQSYVLDVLYTDRPMEYTEMETAKRLYDNHVESCKVESNNGGRGFARAVKAKLWDNFKTRKVHIEWFTQTSNKRARIVSNETYVCDNVLFPDGWDKRWPDYHRAMTNYKRKGANEHDDAPDATTGLAEWMQEGISRKLLFGFRSM